MHCMSISAHQVRRVGTPRGGIGRRRRRSSRFVRWLFCLLSSPLFHHGCHGSKHRCQPLSGVYALGNEVPMDDQIRLIDALTAIPKIQLFSNNQMAAARGAGWSGPVAPLSDVDFACRRLFDALADDMWALPGTAARARMASIGSWLWHSSRRCGRRIRWSPTSSGSSAKALAARGAFVLRGQPLRPRASVILGHRPRGPGLVCHWSAGFRWRKRERKRACGSRRRRSA